MRAAAEFKRQVTRGKQDLQPLTWPAIGGLEWRSTPPARRRGVGVCVAQRIVGLPGWSAQAGCPGTAFRFTLPDV